MSYDSSRPCFGCPFGLKPFISPQSTNVTFLEPTTYVLSGHAVTSSSICWALGEFEKTAIGMHTTCSRVTKCGVTVVRTFRCALDFGSAFPFGSAYSTKTATSGRMTHCILCGEGVFSDTPGSTTSAAVDLPRKFKISCADAAPNGDTAHSFMLGTSPRLGKNRAILNSHSWPGAHKILWLVLFCHGSRFSIQPPLFSFDQRHKLGHFPTADQSHQRPLQCSGHLIARSSLKRSTFEIGRGGAGGSLRESRSIAT